MIGQRLRANSAVIATVTLWGAQVPILSALMTRWDPFFLSALRYTFSALLFVVVLKLFQPGPLIPAGVPIGRLWLLGGVGIGSFGTLYVLGVAYSNPITAAVVSSCSPIVAAVVAWMVAGTRPRAAILPSLGLAVAGGILATARWEPGRISFELGGGEILIVLATGFWSWYSIAAQRWLAGHNQLRITGMTVWPAAVVLTLVWLALAAAGISDAHIPPITADELALLAWATIGANALGTMLWNYSVRHLGVVVASFFVNLMPLVAIAAAMILGIYPRAEQLLGCALVILGIVYAQLDSVRAERAARASAVS